MEPSLRIATGVREEPNYGRVYDSSDKGRNRRTRYNAARVEATTRRYLDREFIAWDGEGGNESDGSHTYFILANSDGQVATDRTGLSTVSVLDMFLRSRNGNVTHIIYGGGYDVNMFLRDLDLESLQQLYSTGKCSWRGYWMQWRPGKSFSVRKAGHTFTLYDVLPFFQRSFVAACDEYLGKEWEHRDEIIREKARRGQFDWTQLDTVARYNAAELSTLVLLANELRQRLFRVDIRVTRWDGPGAIASALYKKYETKSYMGRISHEAAACPRYGYAGGRFEIIRKGHSPHPAFQYDLRSAYPSAARHLPCLVHGYWRHREFLNGIIRDPVHFGIYRIEVVNPPTEHSSQPQPLWMRNKDGTVYFSEYAHGWYWSPEAKLAIELGGVNVHEGWEWIQECNHEPFDFIEPLYLKRAALKKAKDGAHVGIKLGLNSLYGKLAQQVGWSAEIHTDGSVELFLPPYHSLEWAGWITSHCRSEVFRASMLAPDDIIAFETDAVFSRVRLPLNLGEGLGEWEETCYADLTYLKSGMYFGNQIEDDGSIKPVEKSRGINKGTITRDDMIGALARERAGEYVTLQAEQTRFVGLGQAMHQDMAKWRRWYTNPREIKVRLNGKRIDSFDRMDARKDIGDGWSETMEGFHETTFSHQYPVAWVTGDLGMASPEGHSFEEYRLVQAHEIGE